MFVKRYGSGPCAYLSLHGWSGTHRSFEPLVRYMPASASLYCADLPGCGKSPAPATWTLAGVTAEIVRSLDTIDAERLTLVGNCIGALLGLCAALERPERIRRLVLIDAFACWPWYFRVFTGPSWGSYAYSLTFANPIGRWIANQALAAKRSTRSNLTEGFAAARQEVQLNYLRMLTAIESPRRFLPLDVPTDIVFGARSFDAVRESAAEWKKMWPHARVRKLARAGHLPLVEAPITLSRIIFEGGACQPESLRMSNSTAR